LPLELALALHADDVVLKNPVVFLVRPDAVERRFVDAEAEPGHDVGFSAFFALDGNPHRRAVRRDRLDDQVVVLRGRVLLRYSPDAGELAGPRDDPQLVLLLELRL